MNPRHSAHPRHEVLDCARCGSAGSIEFGICQVCLSPPIEIVILSTPRAPDMSRAAASDLVTEVRLA
jgi:hypothetical protein